MTRALLVAAVLVVVALYAVLSGRWVSSDPGWYDALPKPSWQPPPWVFGVVWPLNFLALTVSGVAIAWTRPTGEALGFLALLVASVAAALTWAHAFYVPHDLGRAALALVVALLLTVALVVVAAGSLPWAGWVLVPYAVWMAVATSLALAYWRLVPEAA
ncbi:TspO/MBR family protein [Nostocoides sp. Soil756]|jgi:benzodiazapine receptor|uniref:tryptophan-rich sensory protein n=1 Tax=Nostocoides sp. Soil756 TaxID=1736399 RepID=UPI000AB0AC2D|nr:TspO/MBR family protein [Tetrasphaera sp. Soil756]